MAILDQWGNPITAGDLKERQATPDVMNMRDPWSDHVSDGMTPEKLAGLVKQSEQGQPAGYLALAQEMELKDLHYAAVLGTRKRQVAQLPITVTPAGDGADQQRHAEFIEDFLDTGILQGALFDMLDAVGKGFSLMETDWDTSARQWMPQALHWVDPRWIEFDRNDGTTPMLRGAGGARPLDPGKFIYCRIKVASGLPLQTGIARPAAWAYLFKNFDVKAWVQFADVYGHPLRVGMYGPGATAEDKRKLLRAVAGISRDAAAVIPESMKIEFVKSEGRTSVDMYEKLAAFMERQQSKIVLGQTTTTDAISGGHAVSQEHNEVREDIEQSDCVELASVINRDLIRLMVAFNFGEQAAYPQIHIGRAEQVDPKLFSEVAERAVKMGVPVSKSDFYGKTGLKPPEDDEDSILPPAAPPAQEAATRPEGAGETARRLAAAILAAAEDKGAEPHDALERYVKGLGDGTALAQAMAPLVEALEKGLSGAASYDDFVKNLAGLAAGMDVNALGEMIARARFEARIAGAVGADIGDGE